MGNYKNYILNEYKITKSDYHGNENNDGNIGVFLKNISDETQIIHRGDRIAQGVFLKYLVADNGNTDNERNGGFGSTGV